MQILQSDTEAALFIYLFNIFIWPLHPSKTKSSKLSHFILPSFISGQCMNRSIRYKSIPFEKILNQCQLWIPFSESVPYIVHQVLYLKWSSQNVNPHDLKYLDSRKCTFALFLLFPSLKLFLEGGKQIFLFWRMQKLKYSDLTLLPRFTLACLEISSNTMSGWPSWEARCNGVTPCNDSVLAEAPCCSKLLATLHLVLFGSNVERSVAILRRKKTSKLTS